MFTSFVYLHSSGQLPSLLLVTLSWRERSHDTQFELAREIPTNTNSNIRVNLMCLCTRLSGLGISEQ